MLAIFAAVPTLIMVGYTGVEQRRQAMQQVHEEVLQLAREAASDKQRFIRDTRQFLYLLSRLPEITDNDAKDCSLFLARFIRHSGPYSNFGYIKPDGKLYCSAVPHDRKISFSNRTYFKRAIETRDFTIGGFITEGLTETRSFHFAYPVLNDESNVVGVVYAALSLDWLEQMLARAQFPTNSIITVIDEKSIVLARYPNDQGLVGKSMPDSALLRAIQNKRNEATVETAGFDGILRLYGISLLYGESDVIRAHVVVGVPADAAYAPVDAVIRRNIAIVVFFVALLIATAWWGSGFTVMGHWYNLMVLIRRLKAGDFSARVIVPRGNNEFSQLANTFNDMAMSLEKRAWEVEQHLAKISRLNRMYEMLSGVNSAILRIHDKQDLQQEVCRIAVELGQFPLVWIGEVNDLVMQAIAQAGVGQELLKTIRLNISSGDTQGNPIVTALKEQRYIIFAPDQFYPMELRDQAATLGLSAGAVFPLDQDGIMGAIIFYASESLAFDADEVRLLLEVAADIRYALDYLRKEQQIERLAYHDPMTGLPNRSLFEDHVSQAIQQAKHSGTLVGVAALRITRFSDINRTYGHHIGDIILNRLANFLEKTTGEWSTVSRLRSDQFGLIFANAADADAIAAQVTLLLESFPISIALPIIDDQIVINCSLGVAVYPNDSDNAEMLIKFAVMALHTVQDEQKFLFYSPAMNAQAQEQQRIERGLRHAIIHNELVLYYQAVVSTQTRRVIGVESLLRWRNPELGGSPARFIHTAESTGLIFTIGEWVLESACRQANAWRVANSPPVRITFNISVKQLQSSEYIDRMIKVLDRIHCNPQQLALAIEVTESQLMENVKSVVQALQRLKAVGMAIYIDDFGTGYSSLSYLQCLPLDVLKIDYSFIKNMTQDQGSRAIVRSIVAMAHNLNLRVVAEGVETEQQFDLLKEYGCDAIQGYLFSRPALPEDVQKLFDRDL